jgi:aryl-alcohol dehydrogenase-like predicted oxidoreductase
MKFSQAAAAYKLPKVISLQNSYSLLVRSDYESGLTEVCSPRNENVGLLAYSPLCGGILTGKYARDDCPKTSRLNLFEGLMPRYKQSIAQEAVKEYSDIAEKAGLTPTELALCWVYNQPHVASTIIGATTVKQLKENLDSYSKRNLVDQKVCQEIEGVYKKYRDPSRM